jgi:hypothetical protein
MTTEIVRSGLLKRTLSSAIKCIAALICVQLAHAAGSPPGAGQDVKVASRTFLVFESLAYIGKPDLTPLGVLPARGTGELWRQLQPRNKVDKFGVRQAIACCKDFKGVFYLDVEHWPVFNVPDQVIDENISKFIEMADVVRQAAPNLKFGYYAVMPVNAYWPIAGGRVDELNAWRRSNQRTQEIARHVDVIFPSLYTFYMDSAGWELVARETLKEAKAYGKPVYAFLWPEFHDSNKQLRGQNLPREFWRKQLEFCRLNADGIVIWGGWQRRWDENAGWWQETKLFLQSLRETARP